MTKPSSKNHAEDQQGKSSLKSLVGLDDSSLRKLLDILNKNNDHRPKKLKALQNVVISVLQCDKDRAKKVIKALKKTRADRTDRK